MPLIGNGIKSKTAGKSGLNNRIYQLFYDCLKKHAETDNEKVSLSTGPFLHTLDNQKDYIFSQSTLWKAPSLKR